MKEICVKSWEEFEEQRSKALITSSTHESARFLFRGQENASWHLTTTLERYSNNNSSVEEYYRTIRKIHPAIESLTESTWMMPSFDDIENIIESSRSFDLSFMQNGERIPVYSYMAYLRHHGFPSPLLDWTESPYVAAYFAFRKPSKNEVAIFAYSEIPNDKKNTTEKPSIYALNSHIRTHKRHFLQQSKYTICLSSEENLKFVPHEEGFSEAGPDQDILYKFLIPSAERLKVLKSLDEHNLNAFSLFGTEEGLMEALAIREFGR